MSSDPRVAYLPVDGEPILTILHPGSTWPAVLVCGSFGWFDICSYRSRWDLAERLAAAGHPVLRFDLPGVGDSEGDATLESWVAATAAAAGYLRRESGCSRLAAVGIDVGALLALLATADGAPIDDIALWGTPTSGKALVRELRAYARLEGEGFAAAGYPVGELPEGAAFAVGGFPMPERLADELGRVDPAAIDLPPVPGRRFLLLERDGRPVDDRLRAALDRSRGAVEIAPGPGFDDMHAVPHEARPPLEVFDRLTAWLAESPPDAVASPEIPVAPAATPSITLEVDGETVRESPFWVEHGSTRMLGILAEPSGSPRELCAVLLNAGGIRRIGPSRMWVELARSFAARGVPTLRFDMGGVGDADADPERHLDEPTLYDEIRGEHVVAALDALETAGSPRRFVVAGLCSGAYWSFQTAVRDQRVVASYLLNPRALVWNRSLVAAREVRKLNTALSPSKWLRARRGARLRRALTVTRAVPRTLAGFGTRRASRAWLTRAVEELGSRGVPTLLVFSGAEPLVEELERDGVLAAWPLLELDRVPGVDHTLRPPAMQEHVYEVVRARLERDLEAGPERERSTDVPLALRRNAQPG